MHTNRCILIEISMEIRMIKNGGGGRGIIESCVLLGEFTFTFSFRLGYFKIVKYLINSKLVIEMWDWIKTFGICGITRRYPSIDYSFSSNGLKTALWKKRISRDFWETKSDRNRRKNCSWIHKSNWSKNDHTAKRYSNECEINWYNYYRERIHAICRFSEEWGSKLKSMWPKSPLQYSEVPKKKVGWKKFM